MGKKCIPCITVALFEIVKGFNLKPAWNDYKRFIEYTFILLSKKIERYNILPGSNQIVKSSTIRTPSVGYGPYILNGLYPPTNKFLSELTKNSESFS
jgi:hypothetical protein